MRVNASIFKAYDVRGVYPADFNEKVAYAIAQAYAKLVQPKTVVLAMDVRESGPKIFEAVQRGLCDAGVDVIDIGMVSTDLFYYAVASLSVDGGITISASHNPREWNGMNICRRGAVPIALTTGLANIRDEVLKADKPFMAAKKGGARRENVWNAYARYVLSYIDAPQIKPMKIVANANCGMQAKILEHVVKIGNLPLTIIPLNAEPDGTFPVPHGHPNPLIPENRGAFLDLILKEKANMGVSWDADGDRCFLADETGFFVDGYYGTALLASLMLKKHPGAAIVSDPRNIWAVVDTVKRCGGIAMLTKPGMTVMPAKMKEVGAVFGGEMSAHYYFKDNWYRDNGIIPFLLMAEVVSISGKPFSAMIRPLREAYPYSGEINFTVMNTASTLSRVEARYVNGDHASIDGVTVEYPDWRFNLRASNTEPLIRLNIEAKTSELMRKKVEEISAAIRSPM